MKKANKFLKLVIIGLLLGSIIGLVYAEPQKISFQTVSNPQQLERFLRTPDWGYGDHLWRGTDTDADTVFDDMFWDTSLARLHFEDDVDIGFGNTSAAPDIRMGWDGSTFDIISSTAGYDIKIGAQTAGIDVIWYADVAGSTVTFTEETCIVNLAGRTLIQFAEQAAPDATDHGTANPPTSTGWLYCKDDGSNSGLYWENDAGAVTQIGPGGGDNTLNAAYDEGGAGSGKAIDVADGAVALSNSEADANPLLTISHTGTADGGGILITQANGSGASIEFENTGTGMDLEGTAQVWYIDVDGSIVGLDLDITGAAGITLQLDETITNSAQSEIAFTDSVSSRGIIFDLDASATAVGLKAVGAVAELQMGAVDDLTGVGTIVFDAASSSITHTSTVDATDLTIAQAGNYNSSLLLTSTGTGADAISLITSAGGIDITVAGAAGGEDIDITADSSINLTSTEADAQAIKLASTGGIDVDAADDINILVTASQAAEDLILGVTGTFDASVLISSAGTGTDAISLQSTDTLGGIDIDAAGDINILVTASVDGEDLLLGTTGTFDSSVLITSAGTGTDAIKLQTTNTLGAIDIDAAGDIDILVTAASDDEDLILATTGTFDCHVSITSSGTAADAFTLATTQGGMDIAVVGAADGHDLDIGLTGAFETSIDINSTGTGADAIILETSDGGIDIIAVADADAEDIDITQTGDFNVSIDISTSGTSPDALRLEATAGGLDVDVVDDIIITMVANANDDDFELIQTGAFNVSISLQTAGTGVDAIDMAASAGGLDIDVWDDINISMLAHADDDDFNLVQTGDFNVSIALATTGTGADAFSLQASAGGLDIDVVDDINITVATTLAADDFNIQLTGATESSIDIHSAGTGADAIILQTTDGGIDILAGADATAEDLDLTLTGAFEVSIDINSSGTGADAIILEASAGGIDILGTATVAGEDIDITLSGAFDASIDLNSAGTGVDALRFEATAGGLDIDVVDDIIITMAATAADDDFELIQTGAQDVSISLQTAGTGADALDMIATAGGLDIDVVDDINITLAATTADDDFNIQLTGAADASIDINSSGTGVDAIILQTSDGGIDILATADADAEDIDITLSGAFETSIDINSAGTGPDAIILEATAGGIDVLATATAAGEDIDITLSGAFEASIDINSSGTGADAIILEATAGGIDILATATVAAEDIDITLSGAFDASIDINSSGTGPDAIILQTSDGGIDILATADADAEDIDITLTGIFDASILISSTGTGTDAIKISTITNAGDIVIDSCDDLTLTATDNIIITTADSDNVDASPTTDGRRLDQVLRCTYKIATHGGTVAAHGLGVYLPDNAIVTTAYYHVITTFTDNADDSATLGFGITSDDAAGIVAAVAIAGGTDQWDVGVFGETIQDGAAANASTITSDVREIIATVADDEIDAGELVLWLHYVVSD